VTFAPFSSIYGWILESRVRRRRPAERIPQPVISVGNLTMGGTGKTPMAEALARHFQSIGKRPAILSRGYGRSSTTPVVVSAGEGPLVGPEEGGDEPVELASRLPGVIVAVARRRVEAARAAASLGADLFILDDGYQHLDLARDVNLLLLNAGDPFGNEMVPPHGRLREPLSALSRADAFVLTRTGPGSGESPRLLELLPRWNPRSPVFHARLPAAGLWDERGRPMDIARVSSGRAIAVCGVAEPRNFLATVSELGLSPLETLVFRDHQRYRDRQLARIRHAAERTHASWIITSEKDAVKLRGRAPGALACVRRRVELEEPGFFTFLESRVAASTPADQAGVSR
jgi:tetraacyldisaccharide 4'-kinase